MTCVLRPRSAFVGDGKGLLDELVMACQVKSVGQLGQREVEARAKTLVPFFATSAVPHAEATPDCSKTAPARRRRVSSKTSSPAKTRTARPAGEVRPVPRPATNCVETRCAGPGFFSPPNPEQLPMPKFLSQRG
ncbi:hypothetical protein WJX73_003511 [Symbiochloris irregularis]|uniref:Uncharacterized protein n=1 Tax=Symbiochloris irregularis TaxID=706552 RepID=A0AAW1NQW0_9CHLO